MLHPCNIDPLVPELVRREPHNTHTCQSTECTAESYACSQTNYIIRRWPGPCAPPCQTPRTPAAPCPPGLCDVSNSLGIESGPVILHLPVTQELGHSRITLTDSFSRTMARTLCSSVSYSSYTSCSMSSWLLVVQGQDNGHCSPWTQPSGRYQG